MIDGWHLGEYKKHPNHVTAFDAKGNQIGIIFETASPLDTPRLTKQLVRITRERFQNEDIHPLLTIADFTVRLLAFLKPKRSHRTASALLPGP